MIDTWPITPRPGILDIAAYEGGLSALEGQSGVIKLSSNEGALGPSPQAVAAVKAASDEIGRYPDGACNALRAAIGARFGLAPERIICGAGSDEILGLLARAYAGEGDEVLYSEHGFLMYPIVARAVGATPIKVAERDLCADVDGILARAGSNTPLVYLANPNNPTGSYLPVGELRRLREGLPESTVLVIDSAYAEYVTQADYEAGAGLVDETENVIMTRTFSKIFGLGGLRLGWAYGPAHMIDVLNRIRPPFNVTGVAQVAGIAALEDNAHMEAARELNTRMLGRLADALRAVGITVAPSVGNFVLARFAGGNAEAEAADKFLNEHGIIVRRMGAYGLSDSLRITVGLEAEVEAVVATLGDFMAQKGAADG